MSGGLDVDTVAAADSPRPTGDAEDASPELTRGESVDRYVVLSKLGAGGMGVVYAAYDPELDRKVALKLLRGGGGASSSEAGARLLREARALAKLQHPSVVAIHDVGTHDGRVWIAMEFVAGKTLGQWRHDTPGSWRALLDILVRAGQGVAAAHAVGLLHRDLKPDNIMVTDERVRVMDFGLARHDAAEGGSTVEIAEGTAIEAIVVTQAGALLGTPAYMAPEQLAGGELGPATDQFSFCVTAWQVLYGARAFVGDTFIELAASVLEGRRNPPPAGAAVPTWVRRVLERGMAIDPQERWPSMNALLDALALGHARARRRPAFITIAVIGAAALVLAGWQALDRRRRIAACNAEGEQIASVWHDARAAAVAAGFAATGVGFAADTWTRTKRHLDEYAASWRLARVAVCTAAEVERTTTPELAMASRACLDDQLDHLDALVAQLERPDAGVVQRAATAAALRASVMLCDDEAHLRLRADLQIDDDTREQVRALRSQLAQGKAAFAMGRYDEALGVAQAVLERAPALGWPALEAQARVASGDALGKLGRHEDARVELERAFLAAGAIGRDDLAVEAGRSLVFTLAHGLGDAEAGLHWGQLAQMLAARQGRSNDVDAAWLTGQLASVHYTRGDFAEAAQAYGDARDAFATALGARHPLVAGMVHNLAAVELGRGDYTRALSLNEEALAIREEALGPEHPDVAASLNELGNCRDQLGESDAAIAMYLRAQAIYENGLGPDHPAVANVLNNLGGIHFARGEHAQALAMRLRALGILEHALGREHPQVALVLNNLANTYDELGDRVQGVASSARAVAIYERTTDADHPDLAVARHNLADRYRADGDGARALALYQQALPVFEKALGPDHPHVGLTLTNMGEVLLSRGDVDEARAHFQRALDVQRRGGAPPADSAVTQFALARALWEDPAEHPRALEYARASRDAFRGLEGTRAADLASVEAWLAERD